MTIPDFIDAIKPLARPRHDWILLGDGSICVRDRLGADPINMLAYSMDSDFNDFAWIRDDADERARVILGIDRGSFDRLANVVAGSCSVKNGVRLAVIQALNMEDK